MSEQPLVIWVEDLRAMARKNLGQMATVTPCSLSLKTPRHQHGGPESLKAVDLLIYLSRIKKTFKMHTASGMLKCSLSPSIHNLSAINTVPSTLARAAYQLCDATEQA